MILSTDEVAAELRVKPSRIRRMVMVGELVPLRAGAKPLMFRLDDVLEVEMKRRSATAQAALDTLAQAWRDRCGEAG